MPPIYIVVLEEGADANKIKKEITSLGFKVSRHLPYLNMLIVEGPKERINEISNLEGVKNVETNKIIKPR